MVTESMRHLIIVAEMADGNVRRIRRHAVTTARGAARLRGQNHQLWMTRETAEALGARVETHWGVLPNGDEIRIKTQDVMDNA